MGEGMLYLQIWQYSLFFGAALTYILNDGYVSVHLTYLLFLFFMHIRNSVLFSSYSYTILSISCCVYVFALLRPSFNAELSSVSESSSVEKANQFCEFLRTVLDKHAPFLCGKS